MRWKLSGEEWLFWFRLSLKVTLVVGAVYLAYHFYERHRIANMTIGEQPTKRSLPSDAFVFVPKSYATNLTSARERLTGKPLWIREGYRWTYQPGDVLFEPLERIVPLAFELRGREVVLLFEKAGERRSFVIGTPQRVFVDEIFFVKDPREIYEHWTDEMWDEAAQGVVATGMSEVRIGFALGVGQVVRQSPGGMTRIVDYKQCAAAGLDPVRVTYRDHVAESIEPLGG
ncbi:MAG: hypothetical protein OXB91_04960 [Bryobacterales bacterium]|nr:hypothetical protein [Bryobacterales bacterium]